MQRVKALRQLRQKEKLIQGGTYIHPFIGRVIRMPHIVQHNAFTETEQCQRDHQKHLNNQRRMAKQRRT